ncbi:MAG: hypothetical protein AAB883_00830 [Patescibacteria group bacterium]
MRYRGIGDRTVSLYVAVLIILMTGGIMTYVIMNAIASVDFAASSYTPY